jgi:hypothetical protein
VSCELEYFAFLNRGTNFGFHLLVPKICENWHVFFDEEINIRLHCFNATYSYEELWKLAVPTGADYLGPGPAVAFLTKSGFDKKVLGSIWSVADSTLPKGRLTKVSPFGFFRFGRALVCIVSFLVHMGIHYRGVLCSDCFLEVLSFGPIILFRLPESEGVPTIPTLVGEHSIGRANHPYFGGRTLNRACQPSLLWWENTQSGVHTCTCTRPTPIRPIVGPYKRVLASSPSAVRRIAPHSVLLRRLHSANVALCDITCCESCTLRYHVLRTLHSATSRAANVALCDIICCERLSVCLKWVSIPKISEVYVVAMLC